MTKQLKIKRAKGKVIEAIVPTWVAKEKVDQAWPHIRDYVKAAIEYSNGRITDDDMRQFCKDGAMQLFIILRGKEIIGAVVTELVDYPRKRICRIAAVGGKDLRQWIDLRDQLGEWAAANGCTGMESFSRKGMERLMPDWKSLVFLETDL